MKRYLFITVVTVSSILTFSFSNNDQTPDRKESRDKHLKICVISDLNSSYGSVLYSEDVSAVVKHLSIIKPDIVVCGGDMVAGQKASLTEQNIAAMWQSFNETILKPVSKLNIPFGFTVGNHDASPSYDTDRMLAAEFWKQNRALTRLNFVDSTHFPFYFSYIENNVFFISWDAAGSKIKPEVFEWIRRQLNGKIAKRARLRILLGHLPLFPVVESKNKPGEVISNADSTLTLLKENGVDLYISGHQHAFFPGQKKGVRLLNAGAIGDGPRKIMGHPEAARKAYTI
ncbi:MAG TPA: metallophosphoesterase, partial [Daejeonella sp.]